MPPLKSWFERLFSDDRRRDKRWTSLPLVAHYWDGGAPAPRRVRDISAAGMFLLTEQRWYPNTLVTMTLTRSDKDESDPDRAITVTGRVVRSEADGVGLAFELPGSRNTSSLSSIFPAEADRKTLIEFLASLQADTRQVIPKWISPVPLKILVCRAVAAS
jgi:PilZ domain